MVARLLGLVQAADGDGDDAVINRWTTVVTHPDDLGWLRETLELRADSVDDGDEDELEPL